MQMDQHQKKEPTTMSKKVDALAYVLNMFLDAATPEVIEAAEKIVKEVGKRKSRKKAKAENGDV